MQEWTYLEIAELSELLATFIQATEVGFGLVMHDLVRSDVASLGKSLSADFTLVWSFTGVSTFVGLRMDC